MYYILYYILYNIYTYLDLQNKIKDIRLIIITLLSIIF